MKIYREGNRPIAALGNIFAKLEAVLMIGADGNAVSVTFHDSRGNLDASGKTTPGSAIEKTPAMLRPCQKAPPVSTLLSVKRRVKRAALPKLPRSHGSGKSAIGRAWRGTLGVTYPMQKALRDFLKLEASGGIALGVAALVAVVAANSPLDWLYQAFLNIQGAVIVGALEIRKPLYLWLNDGWMAVFFFLVGLEIKRELMGGELQGRAARLPVIGAVGGMALPALVYVALNWSDSVAMRGWAIPTATDIAFALGVLALLGSRAPASLKALLTAIAIIDDLGAIVIIAAFYTANLSLPSLALGAVAVIALALLNRAGVKNPAAYILVGTLLWVCVLKSGVHATLAGVATAFAVPLSAHDGKREISPLRRLEHLLHPWVVYLVLPAFAFANAGVALGGVGLATLEETVTVGIVLGLLAGKLGGVFLALRLAVAAGVSPMPAGCTWRHIAGLSALCGIGFTMSLFIGSLAFDSPAEIDQVRLGVLSGSVLAAGLGYWLLAGGRVRRSHA